MRQPPDLPVIIAGAGIGGLTLAIALRRAGFDVTVVERASALAEIGAGITLWHNALHCLDQLGVGEHVRAVGQAAETGIIALANGRTLVEASPVIGKELQAEADLMTFHRAELQQALYEALPAGTVRFNTSCVGYALTDDHVDVNLDKLPTAETSMQNALPVAATRERAWLLVGADGIASTIRSQLAADEPRYAGYTCWRGVCRTPSDWSGVCGEIWGKGDRFGVVRLPGDRLYWFAVATAPARSDSPVSTRQRQLLDRFAHYAFEVPRIIAATPNEAIIFRDIVDRAPKPGWSDGCVTLLGDAAHATTPNMGQGAAMAIESAVVLTRCLQHFDTVPDALRSYELTRFPRTSWVTKTSSTIGRMAHWENGMLRHLRNMLVEHMPASTRVAQLQKLTSYDATRVPLVASTRV